MLHGQREDPLSKPMATELAVINFIIILLIAFGWIIGLRSREDLKRDERGIPLDR